MTEKEIIKIIGKEPNIFDNPYLWNEWYQKRMQLVLFGNLDHFQDDENEFNFEDDEHSDNKNELLCEVCNEPIYDIFNQSFDTSEDESVDSFDWTSDIDLVEYSKYSKYLQSFSDVKKEVSSDLKKVSKLAEKTGINTACFNFSCVDGDFYDCLICPNCGEKIEFVRPYLFLKSHLSDNDECDVIDDTENNYHLHKEYEDFVIWFVFPKHKSNLQLYNKLIKLGFKRSGVKE